MFCSHRLHIEEELSEVCLNMGALANSAAVINEELHALSVGGDGILCTW